MNETINEITELLSTLNTEQLQSAIIYLSTLLRNQALASDSQESVSL